MIGQHFVAAHQQVGDFEAVKVGSKIQKNGGNVASYFCTPSGRVIHSVVGPVNADELLAAAQWAVDVYKEVELLPLDARMQHVSLAHMRAGGLQPGWNADGRMQPAWRGGGSKNQRVHQLLAAKPLAPMETVYEEIFHHILGQRISQAGPNLVFADRQLQLAEETGRPLLFVLHREHDNSRAYDMWFRYLSDSRTGNMPLRSLVREYVVIFMPLKEMPALSQRLGRPPFDAPSQASPLFVVARGDGEQMRAIAGWNSTGDLAYALADGLVDGLKRDDPTVQRLRQAQRFLKKLDERYVHELRELIIRKMEQLKAERGDRLASAAL